ncbi:hypothetical protein [Pseudarthrobacter phenanthrenivorans]|uniref:hypothetical protein n=1 Tax=Pseudarthrobacter phenanthrenivorans TaxID=361575 RepID=UPI00068A01A0|nr:hypothetical protein [Pseudarthrobacter phenanthrenivorans]
MSTSPSTPNRQALCFTEALSSFKDILDTADRGGLTVVQRGTGSASIVNTERLLQHLVRNTPANVQVVNEGGAWAMFIPSLPIAGEGTTLSEATADLLEALREYAEDWEDHLHAASNHAGNWALVQIIDASTDEQLTLWLTEGRPTTYECPPSPRISQA